MKTPTEEKDLNTVESLAEERSSIDIDLDDFPEKKRERRKKERKKFSFTPLKGTLCLFAVVIAIATAFSVVSGIKERQNSQNDGEKEVKEAVVDPAIAEAVSNYEYSYYEYDPKLLLPYEGEVTFLSFEPVVAHPKLAYDRDEFQQEIDGRSLTADEFKNVLQKLYDSGFILVDMDDVVNPMDNSKEIYTVTKGELKLPMGKKPLVIMLENFSYTHTMAENGYVSKLMIGSDGGIWDYSVNEKGTVCITRENDAVTILDSFVSSHPEFSLNGAKGCIALTGSDGLFGYKTQLGADPSERNQAISDVSFVIKQLKKTGWSFACHTYSDTQLTNGDYTAATADLSGWSGEVGRILGGTSVILISEVGGTELLYKLSTLDIYPYLKSMGFDRFAVMGSNNGLLVLDDGSGAFISGRRVDGSTLRYNGQSLSDLFNADEILDLNTRLSFSVR